MKRLFDIILSSVAIIFLAPLFLCVAILVRHRLGQPIFFQQTRPGKDGKPFKLIKFRTMRTLPDGEVLPDGERMTAFGEMLRSSSLDELPELWNVLKGDMSLVGPRPLLWEYLPLYTPEQARRHSVSPGITGWAQINGRNAITWEEKFELDNWYIDHQSLLLDIKILWLTLHRVVGAKDISAAGHSTMPPFTGSQSKIGLERQPTPHRVDGN